MILSIIATPIGNLGDLSPRARGVLEAATLILAEDTRTARKLFVLLGIATDKQFLSSHAQSSAQELARALNACSAHEHIALVTDAGTPAISDPGSLFIDRFREKYPDASIVPIPGPSAAIAALSVSGFPCSHFEFLGFLPHKKGRKTMFQRIRATEHAIVFYESPHRILKTLSALSEAIGERPMMIGREMTKQFEEYPRGTAASLLEHFSANSEKVRGEFVVVIAPSYHGTAEFGIID